MGKRKLVWNLIKIVCLLLFTLTWTVWAQGGRGEIVPLGPGYAHARRILVKWNRLQPARSAAVLQDLQDAGFRVVKELKTDPRIWVLEIARPFVVEENNPEVRAQQAAQRLLAKIELLKLSGLFQVVQPDYLYRLTATEPTDEAYVEGLTWGLKNTGRFGGIAGLDVISDPDGSPTNAWDITTGSSNVVVAVLDSGVRYTHKDLYLQMWHNPGEIPNNGKDDDQNGYIDDVFGIDAMSGSGDPWDEIGHGTHVAGVIGASANNGYPAVGVTWHVQIMAIKSFSDEGGFTSDTIEGIRYAVNEGAKVINMSYGGYNFDQLELEAIQYANTNGVLIVASAGNDGNDNDRIPYYPASYDLENIIAVAAHGPGGKLAPFSNYGVQSVDLAAPGVQIYSCTAGSDEDYEIWDGTSAATSFVTGTAALIWSAFPDASMQEVRERIIRSAVPVEALQGKVASGGRLNAYKALMATPDGNLEVSLLPHCESPVLVSSNVLIQVIVNDLFPVTNATVTATVLDTGEQITFQNDGEDPDEVADDNIYSAYVDVTDYAVPPPDNVFEFEIQITASGKNTYTNICRYYIVGPPENDNFEKADKVPPYGAFGENVLTCTNQYATIEFGEPLHAGAPKMSHSVWWKWSPAESGPVIVDTAGSSFDAIVAVYTGESLLNLHEIVSADNVDGLLQPYVYFNATAGKTYWIAVASVDPDQYGLVRLRVEPDGKPDRYPPLVTVLSPHEGEMFLSDEITVQGTVYDPLPSASGIREVLIGINSQPPQSIGSDTNWTTKIKLLPGQNTIRVWAEDWAGNRSRTTQVTVYYEPVEVPNDLFVSILSPSSEFYLTDTRGAIRTSNEGATKEYGEPNHAGNEGGHSIWWTWLAPTNGVLHLSTKQSTIDTLLAVYTGDRVDELQLIGANDDAELGSGYSELDVAVVEGTEYRIAVDGYGGETGKIQLMWKFTPAAVTSLTIQEAEGGRTDPAAGTYTVEAGKEFTIQAIPDKNYAFVGWEGSEAFPPENPITLVPTHPLEIQPVFAIVPPTEDFESGTLDRLPWKSGGDAPWEITDETAAEGTYSVRSGEIGDSQSSSLILTADFRAGTGSFMYKVSSEEGWDFLEFYMDGKRIDRWSGEIDWVEYRFEIPAGRHTLEWRYVKDAHDSAGWDAAFIDCLHLPLVVPPSPDQAPRLKVRLLMNGQVEIRFAAVPGQIYVLEAADSAVGPWRPIATKIAETDQMRMVDPNALDYQRRFYRVRVGQP